MSRVVGGIAGGRRLQMPPGRNTRPTSERAREGLFSTLESMRGTLAGASVLDLYAGSGAVGLEAASRGAAGVVLVERDARTLAVLRSNVSALGLAGVTVRAEPVHRFLADPPPASYDVVFLDPPYAEEVDVDLELLSAQEWLNDHAVVVVERSVRSPALNWPDALVLDRSRRYGDTVLCYGRRS